MCSQFAPSCANCTACYQHSVGSMQHYVHDAVCPPYSMVQCAACIPWHIMVTHNGTITSCKPWLMVYGTQLSVGVAFAMLVPFLVVGVMCAKGDVELVEAPPTSAAGGKAVAAAVVPTVGLLLNLMDIFSDWLLFLAWYSAGFDGGTWYYQAICASLGALGLLFSQHIAFTTPGPGDTRLRGSVLILAAGCSSLIIVLAALQAGDEIFAPAPKPFFVLGGVSLTLLIITGAPSVLVGMKSVGSAWWSCVMYSRARKLRYAPRGSPSLAWKVKSHRDGWQGVLVPPPVLSKAQLLPIVEAMLQSTAVQVILATQARERALDPFAVASLVLSAITMAKDARVRRVPWNNGPPWAGWVRAGRRLLHRRRHGRPTAQPTCGTAPRPRRRCRWQRLGSQTRCCRPDGPLRTRRGPPLALPAAVVPPLLRRTAGTAGSNDTQHSG